MVTTVELDDRLVVTVHIDGRRGCDDVASIRLSHYY